MDYRDTALRLIEERNELHDRVTELERENAVLLDENAVLLEAYSAVSDNYADLYATAKGMAEDAYYAN